MNFGIFLIIFSFVQTTLCSQSNATGNDTSGVSTLSWLRRKRAQGEYTRWRATQDTTHEFIVQVLDDDLITHHTPKIVAVNIEPLTRNEKKIIVGGALVPPIASFTTVAQPIDYTRFIPPTTIPVETREKSKVKSIVDDSVVLPRGIIQSESISLPMKHPNRDESPPSGPQFLGRTSTSLVQQYAPVTPVSFYRGRSEAPLTPRSLERFLYKTPFRPTRTSLFELNKPMRTTSKTSFHNIFLFDNNDISDEQMILSRNSMTEMYDPKMTLSSLIALSTIQEHDSFGRPTDNNYKKWRMTKGDQNIINESESELSYNTMVQENEEGNGRKSTDDKSSVIVKGDDQYEHPFGDLQLSKALNESFDKTYEYDNTTDSESVIYFDEEKNSENSTLKQIPTHTTTLSRGSGRETLKSLPKQRKQICSMVKLRQLNFNSPRTLPEIVAQLKQWAETSPVAKWVDITNGNYTTMENPIYMMIVDDPSSGQIISAKKTVMVVAGIQGRDHHSVAAAMYVLYQLIERSEAHSDLLTKYRFWVIPIFNPDGYDYSMTFPHRREWTKNLRQKWDSCKGRESCAACELYGLRCTVQTCYGVNLDRNFEYQWIPTEELRAEHPCGALYAGERQLSEAETRALTHFLHERRNPLFTFVAFKEGNVLGVLYPYSHTRKRRAFDSIYRQRASHAASAAYSIGGRPYVAGQTSEFLPLYAGGIEDWVDGHLGIDNTYTIMMFRPSDSYNSKLITERVVHEAYAAMDTLLLQSANTYGTPPVTLMTAAAPPPAPLSLTAPLLFLTAPILCPINR